MRMERTSTDTAAEEPKPFAAAASAGKPLRASGQGQDALPCRTAAREGAQARKTSVLGTSIWSSLFFGAWLVAAVPAPVSAAAEKRNTETLVAERLAKKQKDKSLLDIYSAGGWLMHPIAACSLGTVAAGIYAWLLTSRRRISASHLLPHLQRALAHRRIDEAYETCRQHPGLLTDALGAALVKAGADLGRNGRAPMEQAAADTLAHGETRFMYWINYLNFFATVAPMLGLLGTVTGMIQAFDKLAAGLCEPQDLAGGIGEAMITTAGGLIVGIPAMLMYLLYRNNVQSAVTEVQKDVVLLLDILAGDVAIEGIEARPAPGGAPEPAPEPAAG